MRMRGSHYQSKSRGAYCNESGAESDKCGSVPTVDASLFPAGRKPPPHESSRDEDNHEQDGHSVNPSSLLKRVNRFATYQRSAGGGMLRSDRFASGVTVLTRFRPRQIKVSMQSVKRCGRKLVSPLLELRLGPTPVQSNGIVGEVFRKRQPVLAFTHQDVANSTPGRTVVYVPARHPFTVEINQKHFPMILEVRPVIPSLAGFELGVGPPPPGDHDRIRLLVMRWIMVKDPLAGLADDHLSSRAYFIVGLGTQHDLACQTLLIPRLGKAASAVLRDPVILTQ